MRVKLVVVRGQPHGKSLQFPVGEFLIGRGRECFLRPNSSWVSRQHCLLRVTEQQVVLCDLGSTNGTLVNGSRLIGERSLAHGDRLQIGPLVFEIHVEHIAAGPTDSHIPTLETAETPGMGPKRPPSSVPSSENVEVDDASLTQPRC